MPSDANVLHDNPRSHRLDSIEVLIELLRREAARADAETKRADAARRHEHHVTVERQRAERDRDAAEAKIDELRAYAARLLGLLPSRHRAKAPAPPKLYAREIPF